PNFPAATALDVARRYIGQGFAVIPIPHKAKSPNLAKWQTLRITEATADQYFGDGLQNIGALLGEPSGKLIDIDLDCAEAVQLAPKFLPETPAIFGRESKPQSHYLYFADAKTAKFQTPDGRMIVELRSTGAQTVFPHSTHPSGEVVTWDSEGTPQSVEPTLLRAAVAMLAACALLAQVWNKAEGSRHDLALALAGGLMRSGWAVDDAKRFICAAAECVGDDEL
ncbi:MAG: bifunctional DNA primase/polymerase, partial [Acidobacteriota bacterium]|nr:bifunctional DNA primase/polymerase [Acidobacteriota bacterium]